MMRQIMLISMLIAGSLALYNILLNRVRWLSLWAFGLVMLALLFGGHKVPVDDLRLAKPYVGLDWLILDLLG